MVLEAGGDFLLAVLGIDDMRNCFGSGNVGSCASLLLNFLPVGKLVSVGAKIFKFVARATKAVRAFYRELAAAEKTLNEARIIEAEVAAEIRASQAEARAEAKVAESCPMNSFTGDTPVKMADGSSKPIAQVKVGDKVLATDSQTGKTAVEPVDQVIVHGGPHTMVDVHLSTGATLTATDHHPFWDATTGAFTYAADLHVGDQVLQPDGQRVTITTVKVFQETVTAYNLTIHDIHTYYAGTTPVLVHNANGPAGCSPYQVGTYSELKGASKPGDGPDVHHVPQGKPAGQVIPGYDSPNAPAIAIPRVEHAAIPNLRGVYNGTSQDLIANDLNNLSRFTNTPQSSIDKLTGLIDQMHPGAR